MNILPKALIASAALVLAFGASGAVTAAFADTVAPATASTDSTDEQDPTFVLTDNGGNNFALVITVPGTSVAVGYTLDATGAVTSATTSTAGASVTVQDGELHITLSDGRTLQVELGDKGTKVEDVSVEEQDGDNNNDTTDTNTNDQQGNNDQADNNDQSDNNDQQADEPKKADENNNDQSDSQDSGSSD